jgi:hypothetical protein
MGTQGTIILDAGSFFTDVASGTVSGQTGLQANSLVEAWMFGSTADHGIDEHWIEPMNVIAHSIIAGSQFSITLMPVSGAIYGKWGVAWCWN